MQFRRSVTRTRRAVCTERRVAMGQLKSTEEERDVIASKLEHEMLMKSVEVASATSEAKVSNVNCHTLF